MSADFIRFSLALNALDGRDLVEAADWRGRSHRISRSSCARTRISPALHGDADSTRRRASTPTALSTSPAGRGPSMTARRLRALALLRWIGAAPAIDDGPREPFDRAPARRPRFHAAALARSPASTSGRRKRACTTTHCAFRQSALAAGAEWLASKGESTPPRHAGATGRPPSCACWMGIGDAERGFYRSRILASGSRSAKELDMAVIFAGDPCRRDEGRAFRLRSADAGHAAQAGGAVRRRLCDQPSSALPGGEPRWAGMRAIPIIRAAPITSRPWPPPSSATAPRPRRGRAQAARSLRERGDAFLRTVQAYTPRSGEMSEQFDQKTGAQTSARHLAWSYAAFISCVSAARVDGCAPAALKDGSRARTMSTTNMNSFPHASRRERPEAATVAGTSTEHRQLSSQTSWSSQTW